MKLNKKSIESICKLVKIPDTDKSFFDEGMIKNLQIFGNEVIIDLLITNPTLQYKNRIEELFSKQFEDQFSSDLKLQINFVLDKKVIKPIKGSPIPGVNNIIAVSSAKGGVGKSTVTANLAVALSDLGYSVGIVDADIYGPSMHIMFDLDQSSAQGINIGGATKIKPLENYGVKLLSIGFFAQSKQAIPWRGPMASKALNQLIWDAFWGDLDYLLIDLPPGTGDIHLSLVQSIPLTGAIVVSTPQSIALADTRKGINMFQLESINVPILGIVENMSYFIPGDDLDNKFYIFGKQGAQELAKKIDIELLAEIPLVQSIREAADIGRPAVMQGSTDIAIKFIKFAERVVEIIEKRNKDLPATESVKITNQNGCK